MSDSDAEMVWEHILKKFFPSWNNIEEDVPDEHDLQMLKEIKDDPECQEFTKEVTSNGIRKIPLRTRNGHLQPVTFDYFQPHRKKAFFPKNRRKRFLFGSGPPGARTLHTLIKSQVLYQMS